MPFAGVLAVLTACVGTVESLASPNGSYGPGSSPSSSSSNSDESLSGTRDALQCTTPAVGPAPLRRLTHAEYDNSVRDLLGDDTQPARNFAADTRIGLFDNSASAQTVAGLLGEQYLDSATRLAQQVKDPSALTGCDLGAAKAADCVRTFIERFGRRAYRRPLADEESARLLSIYQDVQTASDGQTGVRGVVAAILASPNFLFRPEFGEGDELLPNARQASSFELAGRLASLLWASVPDDALLDAAQEHELATRAQVERQARRMLDDPKARPALAAFYEQWLGFSHLETTTKDANVYPEFDDTLRASMLEETRRFVAAVIWEDDARLSTLLTAPYSFVNGPLAAIYGLDAPADPETYQRVELDAEQRAGVLTQASILSAFAQTNQSSPVKRGDWVRSRLLCHDLPPPPAVVPELPEIEDGVSNRERFALHTSNPACAGCHGLIDGLGFGLEHYDGIGRYRDEDQGVAVQADGEITATLDIDGPYSGGPALAAQLARSEQVRDCLPIQWLRFSLGRHERVDDACSLVALQKAFAASDGDLRELLIALTQTDAFWHYRPPEGSDAVEAPGEQPASVALEGVTLDGGTSWRSAPITPQNGAFVVTFDVTPSMNNMEGITGLSSGAASAYKDLAASVRFSPAGVIDVRNGGSFAADLTLDYAGGSTYHVRMEVDLASHRYSVFVTPPGSTEVALATGYAFRSDQSSVQTLDHVSTYAQQGSHHVENITRRNDE